MYSTEAKAPPAEGSKCMVNQIPVSNWLANTKINKTQIYNWEKGLLEKARKSDKLQNLIGKIKLPKL